MTSNLSENKTIYVNCKHMIELTIVNAIQNCQVRIEYLTACRVCHLGNLSQYLTKIFFFEARLNLKLDFFGKLSMVMFIWQYFSLHLAITIK